MIVEGVFDNESLLDSLNKHQALIDFLNENVGEDGLIHVSRKMMAKNLNKSPTLMAQYINRINLVDECIVQMKPGVYKLNYSNLSEKGVFPILLKALEKITRTLHEYILLSYKQKSELLDVPVSLIPVLEGYMYAGLVEFDINNPS